MEANVKVGMVIKSAKTSKVHKITRICESRNMLYTVNVNDPSEKSSHYLDKVISAIESGYYIVIDEAREELISKYKVALSKARKDSELMCHVGQIKDKLKLLKQQDYEVTVTDEVWIDYFLSDKGA